MPTFDGANLLITLDAPTAGVLDVDVQTDLYSEWKSWVATSDNSKFPPAFRTSGGDPLTPGVEAGAYFFLRNDLGWRIISSDANQTINYQGNLIGEDSSLPIVNTTPGRSVLHLGLQPVTQRVDDILDELKDVQFAAADRGVTVDTVNGIAGTAFPIGTPRQPVSNVQDAVAIAQSRGMYILYIVGNLTLDTGDNVQQMIIVGQTPILSTLTINPGANVAGTTIVQATVQGTMDGDALLQDCFVEDLDMFDGTMHRCLLFGTVTLGNGVQANILNASDGTAGLAVPTIDLGGAGQSLILREYSGGIQLQNKTGTEDVSLDVRSGRILVDDTVVNGDIILRGLGKWQNKSTYAGGANVIDEMVDAVVINDIQGKVQLVKALSGNRVELVPLGGGINRVDVYDDDGVTILRQMTVNDANTSRQVV